MHLTSIDATYGRTHNLGDYSSLRVDITLHADLDDGDDEATAAEALRTMARNQVMLELSRVDTKLAAKVENIFAGLPADVQKQIEEK